MPQRAMKVMTSIVIRLKYYPVIPNIPRAMTATMPEPFMMPFATTLLPANPDPRAPKSTFTYSDFSVCPRFIVDCLKLGDEASTPWAMVGPMSAKRKASPAV